MVNFGQALDSLKLGSKLTRQGWNDMNMFIYLVQGTEVSVPNLRNEASKHVGMNRATADKVTINSHIDMQTVDGSITVGWVPSQPDMLAEDWVIVL